MSRYCKKQGQVLSDIHWCETCPKIEPEPNWRSLYFETKLALKEEMVKSVKYRALSEELKIQVEELERFVEN